MYNSYIWGRIIWDYRRLALYGTDFLIEQKEKDKAMITWEMDEDKIRLREEVTNQIRALQDIATMAASYGCDVTKPARNAREAVQRDCYRCFEGWPC